jgi:alkylhydroperoxidase/carboxymuconolactone decarboxylase family protein YurZ
MPSPADQPPASRAAEAPRRPGAYSRLRELAPEAVAAYESLSRHAGLAGPLDAATLAVVKVALSVGRGNSRGVHAHARKALEAGADPAALRQVALMAVPTLGLHAALDALRWVDEVIEERQESPRP